LKKRENFLLKERKMVGGSRRLFFILSTVLHFVVAQRLIQFRDFCDILDRDCMETRLANMTFETFYIGGIGFFCLFFSVYFAAQIFRGSYQRFAVEVSAMLHFFYAIVAVLAYATAKGSRSYNSQYFVVNAVFSFALLFEPFSRRRKLVAEQENDPQGNEPGNGNNDVADMKTDEDDSNYVPPSQASSSSSSSSASSASE
jgi:hypothetical protein